MAKLGLRKAAATGMFALVLAGSSLGLARDAAAQAALPQANFGELATFTVGGLATYANGGSGEPFNSCNPGALVPDCNWHNANSLEAALDYAIAADDSQQWILQSLFQADLWFQFGGDPWNANTFAPAGYNDDALWWALAFIRGYDLTGDTQALSNAESIFAGVCSWWDAFEAGNLCGRGGVPWQRSASSQLNSITNELFLETAIRLHLRTCQTGNEPWCNRTPTAGQACSRSYIDWANVELQWFEANFLQYSPGAPGTAPLGLIADQLSANIDDNGNVSCVLHDGPYTYNNGVILGGLADMATAEQWIPNSTAYGTQYSQQNGLNEDGGFFYLDQADVLASNITSGASVLTQSEPGCPACGPILTELDDDSSAASGAFDKDHPQFKGIFMRYLGRLDGWYFAPPQGGPSLSHNPDAHDDFIIANAAAIWTNDRVCSSQVNSRDQFGVVWNGQYSAEGIGQVAVTSALDAVVAAMPYSAFDAARNHVAVTGDVGSGRCIAPPNYPPAGPPANAFDGDYTTYWCIGQDVTAPDSNPQTVQVEFTASQLISAVNVRQAGTGIPLMSSYSDGTNFTLSGSADGQTWTPFVTIQGFGASFGFAGNGCDDYYVPNQNFIQPGILQAKFVRLTVPAGYPVAPEFEIEIYSSAVPSSSSCGLTSCSAGSAGSADTRPVLLALLLAGALGARRLSRRGAS